MDQTYRSTVTAIDRNEVSAGKGYEIRGAVYLLDHPDRNSEIGLFVPEGVYEKTPPFGDREEARKVPQEEWRPVQPEAMDNKWFEIRNRTEPRLSDWNQITEEQVPEEIREEIETALPFSTLMGRKFKELGCYE